MTIRKEAWSYSRLADFESCPLLYQNKHITKTLPFVKNAAMQRGSEIHEDLEEAVKQTLGRSRSVYWEPLPETQNVMKFITLFCELHESVEVELSLAFTEHLEETSWYGDANKKVWLRARVDLIGINDDSASIVDWKTGKVRVTELQLLIFALAAWLRYPEVNYISALLAFVDHPIGSQMSVKKFSRQFDYEHILNELGGRAHMIDLAISRGEFPAKENNQCRWCKVICKYSKYRG